jgi:hypothetical protein
VESGCRRNTDFAFETAAVRAAKAAPLEPAVECAFGRDGMKRQDEREWLFDFCARIFEEKARDMPRMELALTPEIERSPRAKLTKDPYCERLDFENLCRRGRERSLASQQAEVRVY